jgi:hypothetical protein
MSFAGNNKPCTDEEPQQQESVWAQLLHASRRSDQTDTRWRMIALGSATHARRALVRTLQSISTDNDSHTRGGTGDGATGWSLAADDEPAGAPMPVEFTCWNAQRPELDGEDDNCLLGDVAFSSLVM